MDKMTIMDKEGKDKYLVDGQGVITDLRECTQDGSCEDSPYQVDGEQKICLVCGKRIPKS